MCALVLHHIYTNESKCNIRCCDEDVCAARALHATASVSSHGPGESLNFKPHCLPRFFIHLLPAVFCLDLSQR